MKKRLSAFMRIKRAKWSLVALAAIFVFCLFAEFVCPCDPRVAVNPDELKDFRKAETERVYDVKTARWSVDASGGVFDFEGPDAVRRAVLDGKENSLKGYRINRTKKSGYDRVFAVPVEREVATEKTLPLRAVSFPFHPCKGHPFGLDAAGRDVYSRVVYGMRTALLFGLMLAFWAMLVGLVVGAIEGYFGGTTDILFQRFTEIWSAIPFLYVMIFIGSSVGRGFAVLLVCYGLFNWITVSYYMRAEFLRLRVTSFVEAAKCQGLPAYKIIFGHILPNAITPLLTLFPFLLMGAISSLAALDFLGFGLPPMTPSCGELMSQAQQFRRAWWLILFPASALFTVMLLTVLVGEGLREAFDPKKTSRIE
jgi:ABC-type microcin C transport system permease subunit YejE